MTNNINSSTRRSSQYKKVYRNSRRMYRGVCMGLWAVAAILAIINFTSQKSINEHQRIRRSADAEAGPHPCDYDKDGKAGSNSKELGCLYEDWSQTCIKDSGFYTLATPKEKQSWNIYIDKNKDRLSSDVLDKKDWLKKDKNSGFYESGSEKLLGMCCMGMERKHSLHNGPIDEFPKFNVFTHVQIKEQFAWLVHLLVSLYMFAALAIVCDDYFVPALERLSEALELTEDVAGATFMAAGSSAPELFTSVIGVFVAKSDIGVGTIVGSAVFNILVIIGACGLFVKGDIPLSWWPLFRDSTFYLFTIIALLAVIFPEFDEFKCYENGESKWSPYDEADAEVCKAFSTKLYTEKADFMSKCKCEAFEGKSRWSLLAGEDAVRYAKSEVQLPEAVGMLIMYCIYIAIMKYNQQLEVVFAKLFGYDMTEDVDDKDAPANIELNTIDDQQKLQSTPLVNRKNTETAQIANIQTEQVAAALNNESNQVTTDFDAAGLRVMMTSNFAPRTRLRMAAKLVAKNQENFVVAKEQNADGTTKTVLLQKKDGVELLNSDVEMQMSKFNKNNNNNNDEEEEEEEEGPQNPWELPEGSMVDQLKALIAWPINVTLWYTVPRCGEEDQKHLYMVSFFMSTVWIAAYSYIMVWMVAYVGFALAIPDTIMGLTFLAAGTSVPDTIASILVAQQGLGDMAVSNSIGSNVFDILLGLALPWTLSMLVARSMPEQPCFKLAQFTNYIAINSSGLAISVGLLLFSLIFVISVIRMNGWKLNTKAGLLIGVAYAVFVVGAVWNEYHQAAISKEIGDKMAQELQAVMKASI